MLLSDYKLAVKLLPLLVICLSTIIISVYLNDGLLFATFGFWPVYRHQKPLLPSDKNRW
ncbi:MAG: hypothetical protein WAN36_08460 [Calditrichia bacterium]